MTISYLTSLLGLPFLVLLRPLGRRFVCLYENRVEWWPPPRSQRCGGELCQRSGAMAATATDAFTSLTSLSHPCVTLWNDQRGADSGSDPQKTEAHLTEAVKKLAHRWDQGQRHPSCPAASWLCGPQSHDWFFLLSLVSLGSQVPSKGLWRRRRAVSGAHQITYHRLDLHCLFDWQAQILASVYRRLGSGWTASQYGHIAPLIPARASKKPPLLSDVHRCQGSMPATSSSLADPGLESVLTQRWTTVDILENHN